MIRNLLFFGLVTVCALDAATAAQSAPICGRHSELQKHGHLSIGVRFDTGNRQLHKQFARAMNFWQTILDMDWHVDNNPATCVIEVIESKVGFAADDIAMAYPDTGVIAFTPAFEWSDKGRREVAFHEVAHLMGLAHNPNDLSVMGPYQGDESILFLDSHDIAALSRLHALRSIPVLH